MWQLASGDTITFIQVTIMFASTAAAVQDKCIASIVVLSCCWAWGVDGHHCAMQDAHHAVAVDLCNCC